MNDTMERMWNEYFLEKCSIMDTEEERRLANMAAQMRKKTMVLLNEEQAETVEEYVEALREMEVNSMRKAFFRGCEFACSFLSEMRERETPSQGVE